MHEFILELTGLSAPALAWCVVAVFLGAYLKGYSGFGASMLWMVSLSLVLPPIQVVPMVLLFEVATSIYLLPAIFRDIRWRSIGMLLAGTWLAMPLGITLLANLPATPIRLALGLAVLVAAILILRGFALQRVPGNTATFGTGLMAGVLNGSMGIVGPPVILFYFSSPIGVAAGRASIIAFFIGTDTVGTALFAARGLLGMDLLVRTALFLPLLLLGTAAGNRGFIRTDPETFRRMALYILMGLALALMLRSLFP